MAGDPFVLPKAQVTGGRLWDEGPGDPHTQGTTGLGGPSVPRLGAEEAGLGKRMVAQTASERLFFARKAGDRREPSEGTITLSQER